MVNVNLMESRYEKTITYEKFSLVFLTHVTNMTLSSYSGSVEETSDIIRMKQLI